MGKDTRAVKFAILTAETLKLGALQLAALLAANSEAAAGELLVIVADSAGKTAAIEQLQAELSMKDKRISELQLQLKNSQELFTQAQNGLIVIEQERETEKQALADQQKLAAALQSEKAELQVQLTDLTDTNNQLLARFDTLSEQGTTVPVIVSGSNIAEHEGEKYKVIGSFKHKGNVITAAQAAADPQIIAHLVQTRSGMIEKI